MDIIEGTEITTVGRAGARRANFKSGRIKFTLPIWSAKTYVAKRTQKEGKLKWFLKSCHGRTVADFTPSQKFINETKRNCKNFLPNIVHLKKVKNK